MEGCCVATIARHEVAVHFIPFFGCVFLAFFAFAFRRRTRSEQVHRM